MLRSLLLSSLIAHSQTIGMNSKLRVGQSCLLSIGFVAFSFSPSARKLAMKGLSPMRLSPLQQPVDWS